MTVIHRQLDCYSQAEEIVVIEARRSYWLIDSKAKKCLFKADEDSSINGNIRAFVIHVQDSAGRVSNLLCVFRLIKV